MKEKKIAFFIRNSFQLIPATLFDRLDGKHEYFPLKRSRDPWISLLNTSKLKELSERSPTQNYRGLRGKRK